MRCALPGRGRPGALFRAAFESNARYSNTTRPPKTAAAAMRIGLEGALNQLLGLLQRSLFLKPQLARVPLSVKMLMKRRAPWPLPGQDSPGLPFWPADTLRVQG